MMSAHSNYNGTRDFTSKSQQQHIPCTSAIQNKMISLYHSAELLSKLDSYARVWSVPPPKSHVARENTHYIYTSDIYGIHKTRLVHIYWLSLHKWLNIPIYFIIGALLVHMHTRTNCI